MTFEEFLPIFEEVYSRALSMQFKQDGYYFSYQLTLDFLIEIFKQENSEIDTEIIKGYIIKACDTKESYQKSGPIIRINNIKSQKPTKRKGFLIEKDKWAWMRPLCIWEHWQGYYIIYVRAKYIRHAVLRYIQYMTRKYGIAYIAFINAYGTQELKKITEARFNEAYLYSIHQEDDNRFTYEPVRKETIKEAYFGKFRHYFKPNPSITDPTEDDLKIAGDLKEKILISSLNQACVVQKAVHPVEKI